MRTCILALGTVLALCGAAAPAAGDPRIPLRPGGVGVVLDHHGSGSVYIVGVRRGSPAEAAGLGRQDSSGTAAGRPLDLRTPDFVLLAVDGRPVGHGGVHHALTALAGPVGSRVEVTVRRGRAVRTVRMTRGDVLAPGAGYTEVVLTRRFVVHHRPGPDEAREARRLARDAERRYAASGLPLDTRGRRAHLWVVEQAPPPVESQASLPAWAAHARSRGGLRWSDLKRVFGYLAYGDPGRVGEEDFAATRGLGNFGPGREQVRAAHVSSARSIEDAASRKTGMPAFVAPRGYVGPPGAQGRSWGNREEVSLRHYTLDRFGIERFQRLWASDLTFNDAVRRELGMSAEEFLRGWEAYVRTLGPDPRAPLSAGAVAGTFAWVGLALLFGVHVARTREVG